MKNKLLIPFFACCIVTAAYGQLYPVSLNDRIDQSTLIIEGKVIEKRSYTTDKGDIFTANKIKIMSVLKGIITEKELTVTTYGGESGGFVQTWTHMLTLQLQDYGLFCLTPTPLPTEQGQADPRFFEVYAGIQGFLKFRQNDSRAWIAQDPFNVYRNLDTDLFKYIAQRTSKRAVVVSSSLLQNGIRYHFRDMDFDGVTLRFNIYVNSLIGTKQLYKANIQFEYNDFFGTNIASNPAFLQNAGVSLSNVYDLAALNLTNQKAQMELLTVGDLNQLTSIGPDEQLMAKGAIPVQNLLANPSVVYDLPAMQLLSKYYENGLVKNFENVLVEGEWGNGELLAPTILDFFPKVVAAGIKDTITIVGSGFGANRGTSRVQFYNAVHGDATISWISAVDSHYLFWSDALIKVLVPSVTEIGTSGTIDANDSYAGTGKIRIRTGWLPGQQSESAELLTIKFCVQNVRTEPTENPANADFTVTMADLNSLGGYSFYYSNAFKSLRGATDAFERALSTWRCATLVNFAIKDSSTLASPAKACRIDMDALPIGTYATYGFTSSNVARCFLPTQPVLTKAIYQARCTIRFNQNLSWYASVGMPTLPPNTYDMESSALHELGHALLLKHSNNHDDLMYFTDLTPPYNRSIKPFDLEGGLWTVAFSSTPVSVPNTTCKPQMIRIRPMDCIIRTQIVEIDGKIYDLSIFPTFFEAKIYLKTGDNTEALDFQVLNTLGQVIKTGHVHSNFEEIEIDALLPAGIYYLNLRTQQRSLLTKKIIKK